MCLRQIRVFKRYFLVLNIIHIFDILIKKQKIRERNNKIIRRFLYYFDHLSGLQSLVRDLDVISQQIFRYYLMYCNIKVI